MAINLKDSPKSFELEQSVTSSIAKKLKALPADSSKVCIYRVSYKHCKVSEEAYTPRLVSIGPLHHGKRQLQAMESYKCRCLQSFMLRFGLTLEHLVKFATAQESSVRSCYEDTIDFKPEKFSEMILLDGVFIIELFLINHFSEMRDRADTLFENQRIRNGILHDMLLLENQLPMSFTNGLFKLVDSFVRKVSFFNLTYEYFKDAGIIGRLELTEYCDQARHLVEFLIYLYQPSHPKEGQSPCPKIEYTCGACELYEAGVRFKNVEENSLFAVTFSVEKKSLMAKTFSAAKGVLKIPQSTVNDSSDTFFRNLMAFEQCGYSHFKFITSYIILMDSLINTAKDVDLLVKHKIIDNKLGDTQQVADLFNNLSKEIVLERFNFYFTGLLKDINEYSNPYWTHRRKTWSEFKQKFKGKYCGNIWTVISLFAGP